MQFKGGYRYPSNLILTVLTVLIFSITGFFCYYRSFNILKIITLFLNLEGTVLIASSLTPIGLAPPPQKFTEKIRWFFKQQGGIPLAYNQVMLYGGLLCLFIATVTSQLID